MRRSRCALRYNAKYDTINARLTRGGVVESFFCVANVLRRGILVTPSHIVVHSLQDNRAVFQKKKKNKKKTQKQAIKINVDSNGETKPKKV